MTLLEKKSIIIDKVETCFSDEVISKLYDDVSHLKPWDETEEAKDMINRLLEKSQEQVRNGEVISDKDHWSKVNELMKKKDLLMS